jgi:hypothetical protein
MDFNADFKRIVEKRLQGLGVKFSADDNLEKLMLLVLNHARKTISALPRQVYSSTEFIEKKSKLDEPMQSAADEILKKLKEGEDVSAHLSTDSIDPAKPDELLADWRIHHFHISNHKKKQADAFYKRTESLLFALVTNDASYFIDIYPHGKKHPEAWTRQDLIRIINKEWPQLLNPFRFPSDVKLSHEVSDLELKKLRQIKVNYPVPVGDSAISTGGFAMDGTPVADVMQIIQIKRDIDEIIKSMNNNSAQWKMKISAESGFSEKDLDFE